MLKSQTIVRQALPQIDSEKLRFSPFAPFLVFSGLLSALKTLLITCLRYRNNALMRCSILLAMLGLALGAWAQPQPASQEEINRALEVLRKTPAVAPPPAAKPGVPL
jgi:predicted membrane protein